MKKEELYWINYKVVVSFTGPLRGQMGIVSYGGLNRSFLDFTEYGFYPPYTFDKDIEILDALLEQARSVGIIVNERATEE